MKNDVKCVRLYLFSLAKFLLFLNVQREFSTPGALLRGSSYILLFSIFLMRINTREVPRGVDRPWHYRKEE